MPDLASQKIANPQSNPGGINRYYGQTMTDMIDTILYGLGYNAVVTKSGSIYTGQMRNGTIPSGAQGTAFHTVLANTIAGLTSGRTWYEWVAVVTGDTTQTANVTIPSYTALDLSLAKITRSGTGYHLFSSTSTNYVALHGGTIQSALKALEEYNTNEVHFSSCTHASACNMTINNAAEDGIRFNSCVDFHGDHNALVNPNRHAIFAVGANTRFGSIDYNYVDGTLIYDALGIYAPDAFMVHCNHNFVENVNGTALSSTAIQLEDPSGTQSENYLSAVDNDVYNCRYALGVATNARPCLVAQNRIRSGSNTQRGIFLQNSTRSLVRGNQIDLRDVTGTAYGIYLYGIIRGAIQGNGIVGRTTDDTIATYGLFHDASGSYSDNLIGGNVFSHCRNAINGVGQRNKFENEIAFSWQDAVVIQAGAFGCKFRDSCYNNGALTDATYSDYLINASGGANTLRLSFDTDSENDAANRIAYHINFVSPVNTNNITFYNIRTTGQRTAPYNGVPVSNFIIIGSPSINPLGLITNPFNNSALQIGVGGVNASPVASSDYVANGTDMLVTSTGGTGVSISIKDNSGNVIESGLATLTAKLLPRKYKINFGAFSVAPTVTVYGL